MGGAQINPSQLLDEIRSLAKVRDWEAASELCWYLISEDSVNNADRADAYALLGQICFLVNSEYDGGHHGLGFFALALLHDQRCEIAIEGIVVSYAKSGDRRDGHIDGEIVRKFIGS